MKEVRPTPEEECGVGCIVGVAVASAIMIIIAAVLILYCKYHSQTRHKKGTVTSFSRFSRCFITWFEFDVFSNNCVFSILSKLV